MNTEYGEAFFDGFWHGKCEHKFEPKESTGTYADGYFDGYGQGREEAADRGPWTLQLGSSKEQESHEWESLVITELQNNIAEVAEICKCGAKRKTLVMHDRNNTWMKSHTFETDPDPLFACPCMRQNS